MQMRSRQLWCLLLCAVLAWMSTSCAQRLGDIDRTQPNKLKKSDLQGVWYMLETVTDLPATSAATFEGETGMTEKIVWQIEEDMLLAYRSYPRLPGSDNVDGGVDYSDPNYRESPVAAFPILDHFDVQRTYDSSTGEQSNVIVENASDRQWYEREFMRVDWSRNLVTNFNFIADFTPLYIQSAYQVDAERGDARSIYFEREGADLVYFDVPRRLLVEPDYWGCIYSMWWGWGTDDCTVAEVEMVTSFAKTTARRDYEPLKYDDRDMSRFGYFRSERMVHDPQRGALESIRSKLANRHSIWEESYQKNADGSFARDAEGKLVPIPMAERQVRTVAYYLSTTFPDDEKIQAASVETMRQWNEVGKEAAAVAKGVSPAEIGDVFVMCNNPVREGDSPACGATGFSPRPGDLRYSTMHWVEAEQIQGPLGYGPAAVDPETGETISGRAYVYGSGLNTYASYALDVIRFMNGDLDPEELKDAKHVRELVRRRADANENLDKVSPKLKDVPLRRGSLRDPQKMARREQRRTQLRRFDRNSALERLERAGEAGLGAGAGAEERLGSVASRVGVNSRDLDPEVAARFGRTNFLNPTSFKDVRRRRQRAMARNVDFADLFDPNVLGIARNYEGRTDYEEIWRELRAELYLATMLHEVGHTVGLRHNFQGSYDAINYHDEYWALRTENLDEPQSAYDLYRQSTLTEAQIDGRMREFQYSSIMDYGMTFSNDIHGLGKYDRAALVYAYSAGAANPGYVEVFQKRLGALGEAGTIMTTKDENGIDFDDATAPIVPYLERWHYSTVMRAFPEFEDAQARQWMRIDEFHDLREKGGEEQAVRVPYLFCSDEWVEALLSCRYYDTGADPFEMTRTIIDDYRAYYYFVNFKRDRIGWDPIYALFGYFYNSFLPISDIFQNWYLAPEGADPVMDNLYWLAINAGFNLLTETIATPPYGTYCTSPEGRLVNLSEDPGQDPEQTSDYYLDVYCDADKPFFEVPQGEGRRRFSTYNLESGYNFADQPLEAGHYWATLAAFWAMTDPEAYVLGSDADVGTFSISMYDFFSDQIHGLVNAVITENYDGYSPLLEVAPGGDGQLTGALHYRSTSPVFDPDAGALINPETGEDLSTTQGPDRGNSICEPCQSNNDCHGHTGYLEGTYCQPIDDSNNFFCLQDCTYDAGLCGPGETCDDIGNCIPDSGTCAGNVPECSPQSPHGSCPSGQSCDAGSCVELWPVVETDATFALVDDMIFYGMFYTTFSFSTRYNDQLNVFKLGTSEDVDPGEGFEVITFTDPILGDSYGAVREACADDLPTGGPTGLCSSCEDSPECAGYTGDFGAAFCQPINDENDEIWYCLIDCTNGDESCPQGTTCNADLNCVPTDLVCEDKSGACSPEFPQGDCAVGSTCVDGACVSQEESARCRFNLTAQTGAAQLVERGARLAERYNETLNAYYADDGSNSARELSLFRQFSRAEFEMESHMEKLNNIRAIYAIFGKVY